MLRNCRARQVLTPFFGRFGVDWLLGGARRRLCPSRGPEFKTVRPFRRGGRARPRPWRFPQ
jgi:hypothetical protein